MNEFAGAPDRPDVMDEEPVPLPADEVLELARRKERRDARRQRFLMWRDLFVVVVLVGLMLSVRDLSAARLGVARDLEDLVEFADLATSEETAAAQQRVYAQILATADCDNREVTQALLDELTRNGDAELELRCPGDPPGTAGNPGTVPGTTTTTTEVGP